MDEDGYFGEDVAATYDDDSGEFDRRVVGETADLLAGLAGPGGRALEFAIGTGRVALPLAGHGVRVSGIDLSRAMVARLRAKPGGDRIDVTIGDFSSTRVEGVFDLVYLVFNTIMNLTGQPAQVACFRNAAAHLRPGGRFALESQVRRRVDWNETSSTRVLQVGPDEVRYQVSLWDPVTSVMSANLVELTPAGPRFYPLSGRMVTHAEMDLMAELAGLELAERWADWKRAPFTAEARMHVSVYRKPA
jgi:SAM-dependent methyltransferase